MEGILDIKPDWKKSPVALGRRSELDVSEFNKLDFVSNGKIEDVTLHLKYLLKLITL